MAYNRVKKSSAGQAPLLAGILFLLLVPTTIIIAENATDNITGQVNALPETNATHDNQTNVPDQENENFTADGYENITLPENATDVTIPINETDITIPEDNVTTNITSLFNETNITIPDNESLPDIEPEPEEEPRIVLEVNLHMPERANRNEPFILSAEISNLGDTDARDVEVEWVLPDGLSILAGSGNHYCDVPAGATCTSDLKAAASLSSVLGKQEIKVLVNYLE